MRRAHSIGEIFTFGGRVPPAVGGLISAIVLASLAGALVPGLAAHAALLPYFVWQGEVWRLFTWIFFEAGPNAPFALLFGAIMLYFFGRDLCYAWGSRRFLATYFGVAAGAAALTSLIAKLAWPALLGVPALGTWAPLSALVIAWAMIFPDRQLLFMFAIPMTGRALLWVTLGGTLLYAIFGGVAGYVPHLLAQGIMLAYVRGWSLRGFWQSLRIRSYERRARRRASHLKVIRKEDPPRWMN